MRAQAHWDKAARLEASRARGMQAEEDYEMIIWSCIHGGAQLVTILLHQRRITDESQDQIHTDVPEIAREVPPDVAEYLAVLKSIEKLGPRFIRGIEPIDGSVVRDCLASYEKLKAGALKALQAANQAGIV